jgi:hypothetical protein
MGEGRGGAAAAGCGQGGRGEVNVAAGAGSLVPSGFVSPSGRIPATRFTSDARSSASSKPMSTGSETRNPATGAHACAK